MSIDSTHPLYDHFVGLWALCRDCYAGQNQVKDKSAVYLPVTEGMRLDGLNTNQAGARRYDSYLRRAVFPETFTDTVAILVGVLNRKEPAIQLPPVMEPMRDKASVLGESLVDVLRKVHEQQLVVGRVGLLVDVPREEVQVPNLLPFLALYETEAMINWDDGQTMDPTRQALNMLVLNETEPVRAGFTWTTETKYRVLSIGDFDLNEATGVYSQGLFSEDNTFSEADLAPVLLRGQTIDQIPFVFIGPNDIDIVPDNPPLLGLANRSVAIYLGEADLRMSLFQTSQDTLVTIGALLNDQVQVGAGARIAMAEGGDAKFIGVDSQGIQHQLSNLRSDYEAANALSARLVQRGSGVESGEALRIRVAAQTASLTSVAKASAAGLQQALRLAAQWMGADHEAVVVEPNLNFADDPLVFQELLDILTFKQRGGLISHRTMNDIMVERDLMGRTMEEEIAEIQAEDSVIPEDLLALGAQSMLADQRGGFGQPFEESEEEDDDDDDNDSSDN